MKAASATSTRLAPHVRAASSAQRLLLWFVLASGPAAAVGVWGDPARLYGFLGQLAVAMTTSALWAWAFARFRRRPVDPGWITSAWLFALLVPPPTPLVLVAVAISFGVVLGHHLFGGTGRALVSPALLGALVIEFGYPHLAADAGSVARAAAGSDLGGWWSALLAQDQGPLGAASPLACLLGAAVLVRVGAASPRTILGGLAAAFLVGALLGPGTAGPPPLTAGAWHLALGSFAFCLAFIATDPSTAALTRTGRWLHGVLAGTLTVLIRQLDPAHPDGVLFAVLMAGLAVPLLDHVTVRLSLARP